KRVVGDVNGDGRVDIVGFSEDVVLVSLGRSDGSFGEIKQAHNDFVVASGWSSQDLYPRMLADINGDGRADIVGFNQDATFVALGQSDGSFGEIKQAHNDFVVASGWSS
ncbi:FG-GAP repeat domain-containing protein, partial [Pseudovibrio japonicus]|uniref:FG-GAP repeat domain-containing protein n=1 Tax=Pseudovibrio japonicus TaxID=366534 RepID=UPI00188C6B49